MRIAWIVYGDLTQPTGGYVYDRLVVEGLRARGDDVEVVDVEPNVDQHGGFGGSEVVGALEALRSSDRAVHPPPTFDALVGDALCARELGDAFERAAPGIARVLLVHHLGSWEVERTDREASRTIEARAVAAGHRLVVTSQATATRLAAEYPGRAIDVVVPGADRLRLHPRASRGDGRVRLLFVGSIIPRKGLPLLLDAIERLADPAVTITLVGDGERAPEHARAIAARIDRSSILRACVTVAGVLDDDALARTIARADALVLPSSLEGYGIVISEALRAGLAVIATREAARATNIADMTAALVFDDVHGLVAGLRAIVADPLRRAAMQRAARGIQLPRWSETIAAFHAVLTRAVADARERQPGRALSS